MSWLTRFLRRGMAAAVIASIVGCGGDSSEEQVTFVGIIPTHPEGARLYYLTLVEELRRRDIHVVEWRCGKYAPNRQLYPNLEIPFVGNWIPWIVHLSIRKSEAFESSGDAKIIEVKDQSVTIVTSDWLTRLVPPGDCGKLPESIMGP